MFYVVIQNVNKSNIKKRFVDIMRESNQYLSAVVKLNSPGQIITFTASRSMRFYLSEIDSSNAIQSVGSKVGSIVTLAAVNSGFHLAQVRNVVGSPFSATYQSEYYPCPFPSEYIDFNNVFKPCSSLAKNLHQ